LKQGRLDDNALTEDTVRQLTRLRFGDKCVSYDPCDIEANSRAVAAGYGDANLGGGIDY